MAKMMEEERINKMMKHDLSVLTYNEIVISSPDGQGLRIAFLNSGTELSYRETAGNVNLKAGDTVTIGGLHGYVGLDKLT